MVSEGQAGHTLGHKASLKARRKAEVVSWILSDHDAIKLEINIVILKMLEGGGSGRVPNDRGPRGRFPTTAGTCKQTHRHKK